VHQAPLSAGQCNPLEFRLLGTFEVCVGGGAITLVPHQQRTVLAILVLHAGEVVVSADRLIEELWNGGRRQGRPRRRRSLHEPGG
jgi:DNA-binding SARP family transcriptional activator